MTYWRKVKSYCFICLRANIAVEYITQQIAFTIDSTLQQIPPQCNVQKFHHC